MRTNNKFYKMVTFQGFLSDEADSSVAALGQTKPHDGTDGPVKRSLLDELKIEKLD